MDTSICRSSSRRASAPGICFYVLPYPVHRHGKFHFPGRTHPSQQMELWAAGSFHVALFLSCWCESPVRRQDIVVFNNPAGIRQPVIDRREIYISRCIGVPGDTLLVDSLFSATSPETKHNPDKKKLYVYPVSKESLITSLMHTFSITDDGLMGSNDTTHVRSFSRYEYYLLEQAMYGQNWLQLYPPKKTLS